MLGSELKLVVVLLGLRWSFVVGDIKCLKEEDIVNRRKLMGLKIFVKFFVKNLVEGGDD